MKKFVTAAVAAVIATGSVGIASAAEAQSRHDRREWRQDQREDRREARQDRRAYERYARQQQRQYNQQQRAYARWQQAQRRYAAPRYVAPYGYSQRQWGYGQYMPSAYRSRAYVVNDYNRYGLRAPPRGYQYVRSGNDVLLTAIAGGLITAVIAGLFN